MSYSQNKEDNIVLNYFGGYVGTLLSIGENDGKTLSNSLLMIENEWQAVLVEPAPRAFDKLQNLHAHNEKIFCINAAIGDYNGQGIFFDSGTHLGTGDTSLLSTLNEREKLRWQKETFTEVEVNVIDFETLISLSPYKKFDYITLDAEGNDLICVQQIDFKSLETKCIIVEWNSKNQQAFDELILPFGFKLLHKNAENLIYTI